MPLPPDEACDAAWRRGQIEMMTTGELVARLHQRHWPWVLGVALRKREQGRLFFRTTGRGDVLLRAGLAGRLTWHIARRCVRDALAGAATTADRQMLVASILRNLDGHIRAGFVGPDFELAVTRTLEHAIRMVAEGVQ